MADDAGLKFETADELTTFLTDLQGQIVNLQETIDKMQPAEEENPNEETEDSETNEEGSNEQEEPTEEELSEIDQLLQNK